MAYGVRYQMTFNDQRGADWSVQFSLDGYVGDPHTLVGGPDPVIIRREGDEEDIWDPIRTSKAIMQFYIRQEDSQFFADTDAITDKTFFISISSPATGYLWEGWLIPDERQRQLANSGYYVTITAVDYFSLLKGRYFQNTSGELLITKETLLDCLFYCFIGTMPDADNWAYRISHVINYQGADTEAVSKAYNDILHQVAAYANVFLDGSGRPRKCDDVTETIMKAIGMYCFYSNGQIHFRSPMALTGLEQGANGNINVVYKDRQGVEGFEYIPMTKQVNTKSFSDSGLFLLENAENLTKDRATKEVSIKFDYGDFISIVDNSNFFGYNQSTEEFTGWTKILGTYLTRVYRVGNGRSYNPYAARMVGTAPPRPNVDDTTDKFLGAAVRQVPSGTVITISIKYKYYDYRKNVPNWPDFYYPQFQFRVSLTNGSQTYSYFDVNYSPASQGNVIPAAGRWFPDPQYGNTRYFSASYIDNTTAVQTCTFTTPKTPIDGDLTVEIMGITLINNPFQPPDPAIAAIAVYQQNYIDIVSVGINIQAQIDGNDVNGEIHYVTQYQDYSLIAETIDTQLGDTPTDTVAGALFTSSPSFPGRLTTYWTNLIDNFTLPLLHMLLRMFMFFGRFPKNKIECDIYGNDLGFEDLLLFQNGDFTYLQGRFMQLTDEYNIRKCRHHIVAKALDGQFKGEANPPPAGLDDQYEFYYETGGN